MSAESHADAPAATTADDAAAAAAAAPAVPAAAADATTTTPSKPHIIFQHDLDPDCIECFYYILNNPGKNVRSILIDAFNHWLCISEESKEAIKEVVTKLHTASLLVDDIEDNSKMRRGEPAAHTIFGTPSVINGANYVYFLAMKEVYDLQNPEAVKVFTEELLNLHRGQGQDILWRDRVRVPTEEQYKRMVLDKTGGLFRLAVGLMQAFSKNRTDFRPFVDNLALYFQVRDDYMNIVSSVYMQNKSFAEDLTEGKFSFPIIHCIRANPADTKVLNILKQRTEDVGLKKFAVKLMCVVVVVVVAVVVACLSSVHFYQQQQRCITRTEPLNRSAKECADVPHGRVLRCARGACAIMPATCRYEAGSFDYTRRALIEIHRELLEQLAGLGGNKALEKLIELMHKRIVEDEEQHGDVPSPLVGLNIILGPQPDAL
jgi:geranylgeranyl diphosphate synthase type 3